MASSIVEIIRQLHQDIEEQIQRSVDELSRELKRHRETLHRNHTIVQRMRIISQNVQQLHDLYNDDSGVLKREIKQLSGSGEQVYQQFMRQYDQITRKYTQRPELNITIEDTKDTLAGVPNLDELFIPNELYGRVIDLQYYHQQYTALRIVKKKSESLVDMASRTSSLSVGASPSHTTSSQASAKSTLGVLAKLKEVDGQNLGPRQHQSDQRHHVTRLYTHMSYATFLKYFDDVPLLIDYQLKLSSDSATLTQYTQWLQQLQSYLIAFLYKIYPYMEFEHDNTMQQITSEFKELYNNKQLLGYTIFEHVNNHRQSKPYGVTTELYPLYDRHIDSSIKLDDDSTAYAPQSTSYGLSVQAELDSGTIKSERDTSQNPVIKSEHSSSSSSTAVKPEDGQSVLENPLFCTPCNKLFAKESVYNAHLTGKHHRRLLLRYEQQQQQKLEETSLKQDSSALSSSVNDKGSQVLQPTKNGSEHSSDHLSTPSDVHTTAATAATTAETTSSSPSSLSPPNGINPLIYTIAQHEFIISMLADLLREIITFSIEIAERKASTTMSELHLDLNLSDDEMEDDQDGFGMGSGSGGDDITIGANHTFTTIGGQRHFIVDGRPIPMWLYKLHGLNIKYSCEICGGDTFLGDRNYKLHFKNWKHTYMLKCLNITNSKEYADVNRIQDVLDLHAKLTASRGSAANSDPTASTSSTGTTSRYMVEVEDALGNITEVPPS